MDKTVRKILFVCTGNIDRSPTAESLFKGKTGFDVQSAGTSTYANRKISLQLIEWADIIFVMQDHHKKSITKLNPKAEDKIIVLNIPDIYIRNEPKLIRILKTKLAKYLNET